MSDRDKTEAEVFEGLLSTIKNTGKQYDVDAITRAYQTALTAHEGQKRVSGEPYVMHPIHVAEILVQLGMDTDTIVAALLHDVVEDTPTTLDIVEKQFGKDVALLVDGVTKLGKIPFSSREEQQAENVRKMLLAMAKDVRVIIIKLADRLHNMRTLSVMRPQKQRDKALETMEVYAPLAHRLGIRAVKEELEDLALRYLDPVAYEEIEHMLELKRDERNQFIDHIKERIIQRIVVQDGKKIHLEGRVKSVYGIYRKVYMNGRSFDEIYDIYAVRIIVDSVIECYNILGIVHDMFRPIPNRFKDYISTPKPNMYQSLHTTVIDKEGIPFEIQIRTWDMHYTAEYG
ncbi:RelA/SpoT family protein, partial [Ligaoa zhengdingensis]